MSDRFLWPSEGLTRQKREKEGVVRVAEVLTDVDEAFTDMDLAWPVLSRRYSKGERTNFKYSVHSRNLEHIICSSRWGTVLIHKFWYILTNSALLYTPILLLIHAFRRATKNFRLVNGCTRRQKDWK